MSKRIQGITIEIDGSTTKLNDALKSTQSVISATNNELKDLNKALKLDPTNTETLARKNTMYSKLHALSIVVSIAIVDATAIKTKTP